MNRVTKHFRPDPHKGESMPRTREEFIRRWRTHLAGTIALGTAQARIILVGAFGGKSSAEAVLERLAETAEEILGKLYDDLQPKAAANGHSATTPARKT